jgi:hypothetical protein
MNLFAQIIERLKQLNISCTGFWNNRDFYTKGSLQLMEHNGEFYWDKKSSNLCYDYPIRSVDDLEQLVKLHDKLDYCLANPRNVTLDEYNKCMSDIRQLRKNWNKTENTKNDESFWKSLL